MCLVYRERHVRILRRRLASDFAHRSPSARTPLCVLFPARIIAAACYILAQHVIEGPQSPSLDVRIASPAPSASLPTPPSHKVAPPEASRFAIEHFGFNEVDLVSVAGSSIPFRFIPTLIHQVPTEVLNIILEFYAAQDLQMASHLAHVAAVRFENYSPHIRHLNVACIDTPSEGGCLSGEAIHLV